MSSGCTTCTASTPTRTESTASAHSVASSTPRIRSSSRATAHRRKTGRRNHSPGRHGTRSRPSGPSTSRTRSPITAAAAGVSHALVHSRRSIRRRAIWSAARLGRGVSCGRYSRVRRTATRISFVARRGATPCSSGCGGTSPGSFWCRRTIRTWCGTRTCRCRVSTRRKCEPPRTGTRSATTTPSTTGRRAQSSKCEDGGRWSCGGRITLSVRGTNRTPEGGRCGGAMPLTGTGRASFRGRFRLRARPGP
mmetsp:Transcript_13951/g.60873  ORF Transcript_13951/g.60873 Transcript_13951/m.60873 type:complete len:250 (-) Transcript_13951:60-809(-)